MPKTIEEKQLIADCLILAIVSIIGGAAIVTIILKALEEVTKCIP